MQQCRTRQERNLVKQVSANQKTNGTSTALPVSIPSNSETEGGPSATGGCSGINPLRLEGWCLRSKNRREAALRKR